MRSIKKVLEAGPPASRLADDGIVDERSPRLSGERSMDEDMLGTSQRVLMSGINVFWGHAEASEELKWVMVEKYESGDMVVECGVTILGMINDVAGGGS